jgi:4-hydroxy-L-threonine phosphate dehydrogenase PdxA
MVDVATTNANTGQNITSYMANQAVNPQIPGQGQLVPVLQNTSEANLNATGQLLQSTNQNTIQPGSIPTVNPQQVTGATNNTNVSNIVNPNAATYNAAQAGAAQGTAATQTVNKATDTVQGQLGSLYNSMVDANGNATTPAWAQAAVTTVNDTLAARGLQVNSSIGAGAITAAVQASAIQIAAADANTYFQANTNTFNAAQQMALQNTQNYQQSLLSNQAASNAAAQFNAQSTAQVQQFTANLVSTIADQNAARIQAANLANQNSDQAAQQFNSQTEFQRSQFNAQNQFAIDQSNVLWRRQLNTANTAAVNAANQVNVQNAFNLSTTAMNNLWQQFQDEASWAFTASEDQKNRDYNLAIISNNQSFVSAQQNNAATSNLFSQLGTTALNLLFHT